MYPETDLEVDPVEWLESVEAAVQEAGGDPDLARNLDFVRRLDGIADTDPAEEGFAAFVREAVASHTREAETPQLERIDDGRVLEARGTSNDGGRIFRVQIIRAGESRNGRNYPSRVLKDAVSLYEGAKAFDHHRTPDELRSSTIAGLVGSYRNVEAAADGLFADLHLLPSATHTAEALDESIKAQAEGRQPLVGISHDAMTVLKTANVGGRRVQEAVRITKVHSADVVADPAAGGKATRVLAGGIDETDPANAGLSNEEDDVTLTSESVLAALQTATPEQLAAVGLSKVQTTEAGPPPAGSVDKASFMGGLMISQKVSEAKLPAAVGDQIRESLPQHITESDVDGQIRALKTALGVAERAGLAPTHTAQVTKESWDKKVSALDGMLDKTGRTPGYTSLKQAWADITGARVRTWDSDINKQIMRDTLGGYDSSGRIGNDSVIRSTESMDTTSWPQVLGDSITRRAIALYQTPSLQSWRKVVSSMPPVQDFRENKRVRIGGYGLLPTVNQGAPYQPLTSPTDEEAAYSVIKRGGTEDLTWEMIVNDDIGKVQQIPASLGLAAAITIYRYVWDLFVDNAATSYDSVALFHTATHANLTTGAGLSQSTLSAARQRMRDQAAYGQATNILSLTPRLLVVPNELEELAFQLTRSAVAIPATPAGPSDTPNLHQGLDFEVIDYWTDANNWFLFADPTMCPLVELGFLFGRQDPEIFTQQSQEVGSMFDSDRVTYKIRHVYAGTPLDHRGMQRQEG